MMGACFRFFPETKQEIQTNKQLKYFLPKVANYVFLGCQISYEHHVYESVGDWSLS